MVHYRALDGTHDQPDELTSRTFVQRKKRKRKKKEKVGFAATERRGRQCSAPIGFAAWKNVAKPKDQLEFACQLVLRSISGLEEDDAARNPR